MLNKEHTTSGVKETSLLQSAIFYVPGNLKCDSVLAIS
jgi:hypothetical protein